jgi:hypothetical protein
MGGLGSDAAIEAADVVIMTDEPSKLATGMKISQKTLRIAQPEYMAGFVDKSNCACTQCTRFCYHVGGCVCRCWCDGYSGIELFPCFKHKEIIIRSKACCIGSDK